MVNPFRLVAVLAMFALPSSQLYAIDDLTDLTDGDPFYYTGGIGPDTTHSGIPHLPAYLGYMQTNDTYRFINVNEQVLTMIGEGKHGLWRVQDNGTVREYLAAGATGLPDGADLFDPANLAIIQSDYSHLLLAEGFDGYKDPFTPVNSNGNLNFIDLPLNHPKYGHIVTHNLTSAQPAVLREPGQNRGFAVVRSTGFVVPGSHRPYG